MCMGEGHGGRVQPMGGEESSCYLKAITPLQSLIETQHLVEEKSKKTHTQPFLSSIENSNK